MSAAAPHAPSEGGLALTPATHAWCPACRAVRPFRNVPIHEASRMRDRGRFDGDRLCCAGCDATLIAVLVETGGQGS